MGGGGVRCGGVGGGGVVLVGRLWVLDRRGTDEGGEEGWSQDVGGKGVKGKREKGWG